MSQHELPAGLVVTPAAGRVLLIREDPSKETRRRADYPLGRRESGELVVFDPALAFCWRMMVPSPEGLRATGPELVIVPESAIIATATRAGEAPPAPPAPPASPAKRTRPPVESSTQAAVRAEAEKAAREALEAAGGRSET